MPKVIRKADQYALIAFLIGKAEETGQKLGKKALQKTVHLIQALAGVDTGYRFSFYTYGPYSASLAGDLDVVANSGGAKIQYVRADNRYLIEPNERTDRMIGKGKDYICENQAGIDRVLETFGGRMAKDLELVSTIAYLRQHAQTDDFQDEAKLVKHVRDLKPKYSNTQVKQAIAEVKGFLS